MRRVSRRRVASSIAAAPARSAVTSIPWSAAGSRPTALVSEVRPPTQSHIGKRARKPCSTGLPVEGAAVLGDRHRVGAEVEAAGGVGGRRLEHAVPGLGGAARFRDDDGQRLGQAAAEAAEHAVEAVGVGVVEEVGGQAVARAAEGVGDELRAERRPADADDQDVAEPLGARRLHPPVVHPRGEVEDARLRVADGGGDLRRGRLLRRAQPVVADHALLVGVGDRPLLERLHRRERPLERRLPVRERPLVEAHAAQVEPHPEAGVVEQQGLVALPELAWGHGVSSLPRSAFYPRARGGPRLLRGRPGRPHTGCGRPPP